MNGIVHQFEAHWVLDALRTNLTYAQNNEEGTSDETI